VQCSTYSTVNHSIPSRLSPKQVVGLPRVEIISNCQRPPQTRIADKVRQVEKSLHGHLHQPRPSNFRAKSHTAAPVETNLSINYPSGWDKADGKILSGIARIRRRRNCGAEGCRPQELLIFSSLRDSPTAYLWAGLRSYLTLPLPLTQNHCNHSVHGPDENSDIPNPFRDAQQFNKRASIQESQTDTWPRTCATGTTAPTIGRPHAHCIA
jgi:hypothetical protein